MRLNAPRAPCLQSFAKTLGQQSIGERFDTFREQSEDGRGFDDSEVRTGYCWSSCLRRNKSEPRGSIRLFLTNNDCELGEFRR